MQPQRIQMIHPVPPQNMMQTSNLIPVLVPNYRNTNQIPKQFQTVMVSNQQQQPQSQQLQYYAMCSQEQQRQMNICQQQYAMMYQMKPQQQINLGFVYPTNSNQYLSTPQVPQVSNFMFNKQQSFTYPMYTQQFMANPHQNQLQLMNKPHTRMDQNTISTQIIISNPQDTQSSLNENVQNSSSKTKEQTCIKFNQEEQQDNYNQLDQNFQKSENDVIQQQNKALTNITDKYQKSQMNLQTSKESHDELSQVSHTKGCQFYSQNKIVNDEQMSQISKTSCNQEDNSNKKRKSKRNSNQETKTSSIQQMSPQYSESSHQNQEQKKASSKNPPVISKNIQKMIKEDQKSSSKQEQNNHTQSSQSVQMKKVENSIINRQKSDTKVIIKDHHFEDQEEKYDNFQNNSLHAHEGGIQEEQEEGKEIKQVQADIQRSETTIQGQRHQYVTHQRIQDDVNDEQQNSVQLSKQETEKLYLNENIQEQINISQEHQQIINDDMNEEIETPNSEISSIIDKDDEQYQEKLTLQQIRKSIKKQMKNMERNDNETIQKKQNEKIQIKKSIKKDKENENGIKSEKKTKSIQQKYLKNYKTIRLENVLPTKTRHQQIQFYQQTQEEQIQKQISHKAENPYTEVDIFQEATQNIMIQFEKHNLLNLKNDNQLIQQFKSFMSNVLKNDEYISQLLNPVECDFSDSFIEFLRGPINKWIKKNIETKKQHVYYQLVNIFKSEDRTYTSLRPRRTQSDNKSNYKRK